MTNNISLLGIKLLPLEVRARLIPSEINSHFENESLLGIRLLPMEVRMQYRHLRKDWLKLWFKALNWIQRGSTYPHIRLDYEEFEVIELKKAEIQTELDVFTRVIKKERDRMLEKQEAEDRLTKALINLSEADACAHVIRTGRPVRVVERDGEAEMGTGDYVENRVKLTIKNNKVIGITFG